VNHPTLGLRLMKTEEDITQANLKIAWRSDCIRLSWDAVLPLSSDVHCICTAHQFEDNYFTEMCSGSEAGSCLRRIDFIYHATLDLRVPENSLAVSLREVQLECRPVAVERCATQSDLTQCIYQLVLESQLSRKIDNSTF